MPYLVLDPAAAQVAPATTIGAPLAAGAVSFEELWDELRKRLLGRVDIHVDRLKLYINFAYVDLATSLRLEELQASISIALLEDQPLYMLPDSVYAIQYLSLAVEDTPDDRGEPLEKTSLDRYRRAPVVEGWPKEYFRHNRMLVVYPTPEVTGEGTLALDFRIRPNFMIQASDYPILQGEWHENILVLAEQKTLLAVQEWEAAGLVENEYIKQVRRRNDPAAVEEDTKVPRSSVPRDTLRLARRRRGRYGYDGLV